MLSKMLHVPIFIYRTAEEAGSRCVAVLQLSSEKQIMLLAYNNPLEMMLQGIIWICADYALRRRICPSEQAAHGQSPC